MGRWPERQQRYATAAGAKVQADASLRISLADGLQLTSTKITEDGMGLNVYDGNNYYPF